MRRFFFSVLALSLLLGRSARAEMVSAVSVAVADSVITYSDIYIALADQVQTARNRYGADPQRFEQEINKLRDQEVQSQVENKLILHDFTSSGYVTNVLEAFVDDRIRDEIQQRFGGDRARFIKTIYARGMTFETYRRQERENFIIGYMKHQNGSDLNKILISPLKIQEYYNDHQDTYKVGDQVKVRMIVIGQGADKPAGTAKQLADEVLAKINAGASFEQLAKEINSDSFRATGGSRGWMDRRDFRPELESIAFSLKPGEHSGVIDLKEACYILQVEDVRLAHIMPLTEVRDEVERVLKTQESLRLYKKWMNRLEKKTFIWYY
ncbi:MAG: peptidyl-prolyl cis-trans isomerase [Limisphaerales bacterium]